MREFTDQEAKSFLDVVLARGETQQLETKRVSGKMPATVCAFANTQGGWLVLGVEDFGKLSR